MSAPTSLIVTGSIELQLDRLAEKVATRVAELLAAGSPVYERPELPEPRTDSDPIGEPLGGPPGRNHPHIPTTL